MQSEADNQGPRASPNSREVQHPLFGGKRVHSLMPKELELAARSGPSARSIDSVGWDSRAKPKVDELGGVKASSS